MHRREFIVAAAAAGTALWAGCTTTVRRAPQLGRVMTVRGAIAPGEMGITLPHEHIVVEFVPVTELGDAPYNREEAFEVALPHLRALRAAGCQTLADATPAFLGRDPILLGALAEATGLHILTNTGYYGAREDVHLPDHAFTESVDDMAARWISEYRNGIGDTGIRPGFIKIGVDAGSLSDMDGALIRAAARTHRATGLTIASHTGPAVPAFDQLNILQEEGVHPSAWIWVHSQAEEDLDAHVEAARRGAWVEFDGVRPDTIARNIDFVQNMKRHRLLSRVLISHDAGWYSVGEPRGGDFRGFTTLFDTFLPALREEGFTDEEIQQLIVENPADAFRIRTREYHS